MPLLPFTYASISQRVADRVLGTSLLCQVATFQRLSVEEIAEELWLELVFNVVYHDRRADGTPGPVAAQGKGIQSWPQTLYANNGCAVYLNPAWTPTAEEPQDPRNGQILYYAAPTLEGTGWETRHADGTRTVLVGGLDAAPEPALRQGDAFALQMEQNMNLGQLIRYHLHAANEAPFSKFS